MPKYRRRSVVAVGICLVVLGLAVLGLTTNVFDRVTSKTATSQTSTKLVLGQGSAPAKAYALETVTGSAAQAKGLGGRASLAPREGMLFVYKDIVQRCMWMKDMRFNIDIVWVDADHRVTSIVPNLNPSTYPQSYCAVGKYVIELPAGTSAKQGLRVGQIIKF